MFSLVRVLELTERSLDSKGYAGDHEQDLVGTGGDMLVHPALEVGEPTLQRLDGHPAETNLVGHKDEGGRLSDETVELGDDFPQRTVDIAIVVVEIVGTPKGDAIDDNDPPVEPPVGKTFLLLDIGPGGTTIPLMAFHPRPELLVPHPGGGEVNGVVRQPERKSLGVGALA